MVVAQHALRFCGSRVTAEAGITCEGGGGALKMIGKEGECSITTYVAVAQYHLLFMLASVSAVFVFDCGIVHYHYV
jgi:hypothetical protein